MARAKSTRVNPPARRGTTAVTPARRLGTSEARRDFSKLVGELAKKRAPGESLVEDAIEVGPQRRGGAWLVSEVDARAAVARIADLEEELENISIGFLIQNRLEGPSTTTPAAEVIRELGFDHLLKDLPG